MMGRLLKYLFYLAVLAFVALVAYTYAGPFFGADFSPPQSEIRQPVTLDAN
jgi:hypothetical protein